MDRRQADAPNTSRGVPGVNDRRALDGIFRVLRSAAPWRHPPLTRERVMAALPAE